MEWIEQGKSEVKGGFAFTVNKHEAVGILTIGVLHENKHLPGSYWVVSDSCKEFGMSAQEWAEKAALEVKIEDWQEVNEYTSSLPDLFYSSAPMPAPWLHGVLAKKGDDVLFVYKVEGEWYCDNNDPDFDPAPFVFDLGTEWMPPPYWAWYGGRYDY